MWWRNRFVLIAAVFVSAIWLRGRTVEAETRSFPAQQGDTVIVQNDYGRIQVRASDRADIQATVRTTLGAGSGEHVHVAAQKAGDKVFLYAFFGNTPGESADFEVDMPGFVNVIVWGANPEVTVQGLTGYARVNTLTGHIRAQDLTGSVSLISDRGEITYVQNVQPRGDARLESTQGSIRGDLGGNLNARVWARAGGTLSVAGESQAGSLEKQLGTLGPLLYLSSLQGSVQVDVGAFAPAPARDARPATNDTPVSGTVPAGETAPASAPKPAPQQPRPAPPRQERDESASAPVQRPQSSPQQPAQASSDAAGNPTFKVNVDWVFLNVSVREQNSNRSVGGLRRDDFLVYEDGVQQQVEQFEPTEVPFNLLLLLDISGSTESYLDLIKTASIDFTRQIKANDRIAVATFNSRVQLIQDFTSDRAEVARSIERIRSGGGTSFYDALETCVDDYIQGTEGRKAIVVFTDGVDNRLAGGGGQGSSTSFEELYRKIQEIDPIIYPIFLDTAGDAGGITRYPGGTPGGVVGVILGDILRGRRTGPVVVGGGGGYNPAAYQQARQQLEMIAEQTGGRMYAPRVAEDLRGVYSEIADDLRIQYRLGYNSTNKNQNGAWREIRVRLKDQPNAVVRTRKGYYSRHA